MNKSLGREQVQQQNRVGKRQQRVVMSRKEVKSISHTSSSSSLVSPDITVVIELKDPEIFGLENSKTVTLDIPQVAI